MNIRNSVSYKAIVDNQTILNGNNVIGEVSIKGTNIGIYSFIGSGNLNNCLIGKFTSISSNVNVIGNTHPLDYVSTYPGFYKSCCPRFPFSDLEVDEFLTTKNGFRCEIGNDVWIGANVLIKGGVKIGDGAVIGMGSVVTKDIPPYAIVGGVPAKVIRFRFSNEIIDKMIRIKWWDWNPNDIKKYKELFHNPNAFVDKFDIK